MFSGIKLNVLIYLIFLNLKSTYGQFKILNDTSSLNKKNHENVTIVQIKPLLISNNKDLGSESRGFNSRQHVSQKVQNITVNSNGKNNTKVTLNSATPSRPTLIGAPLPVRVTTAAPPYIPIPSAAYLAATRSIDEAAKQLNKEEKRSSTGPTIETTTESNRVGKLRETAIKINQELTDDTQYTQTLNKRKGLSSPSAIENTVDYAITTALDLKPSISFTSSASTTLTIKKPILTKKVLNDEDSDSTDPDEDKILRNFHNIKNKLRKYRSKCRCEKIWNCPKMQITISRCPPDHFLCC